MLGKQRLELGKADGGPVLDPGLGEVVLDGMQAPFAHLTEMIGFRPGGYMGRTAYLSGRPGLTQCRDSSSSTHAPAGTLRAPRSYAPLPFSGALTQQVVSGNAVVSTTPLAGVSVGLYHRTGSSPERFDDTGLKAVTGVDGSYRIVLPAAAGEPWYTAVAGTPGVPTWAGRGTVGSVTS